MFVCSKVDTMKDLIELLEKKGGKIKLEITGADLMNFTNDSQS